MFFNHVFDLYLCDANPAGKRWAGTRLATVHSSSRGAGSPGLAKDLLRQSFILTSLAIWVDISELQIQSEQERIRFLPALMIALKSAAAFAGAMVSCSVSQ